MTAARGAGGSGSGHVQDAFDRAGALQCGFCQPGMMLSTRALLNTNPTPTRTEIREALSGNLCRCTGYTQIVQAVELAIHETAGGKLEPPAWAPGQLPWTGPVSSGSPDSSGTTDGGKD